MAFFIYRVCEHAVESAGMARNLRQTHNWQNDNARKIEEELVHVVHVVQVVQGMGHLLDERLYKN